MIKKEINNIYNNFGVIESGLIGTIFPAKLFCLQKVAEDAGTEQDIMFWKDATDAYFFEGHPTVFKFKEMKNNAPFYVLYDDFYQEFLGYGYVNSSAELVYSKELTIKECIAKFPKGNPTVSHIFVEREIFEALKSEKLWETLYYEAKETSNFEFRKKIALSNGKYALIQRHHFTNEGFHIDIKTEKYGEVCIGFPHLYDWILIEPEKYADENDFYNRSFFPIYSKDKTLPVIRCQSDERREYLIELEYLRSQLT